MKELASRFAALLALVLGSALGPLACVNNDSVPHEMASDPHPVHTDCPPLNEVGALAPGRTGVSGALNIARSCGFHDHGQPTNAALQGTVVVQ